MATTTPVSFSPLTSAIPSLPASTRTYKSYNANLARPRAKGSESDAYIEHTNEIDENDTSTAFLVSSKPSPIDPGPLRIQAFVSKHEGQHEREENSDGDSTSTASSPLASSPTTSARPSIDASVATLSCSEMETLMQALHYKISVDHHQTPLYVAAVEYLFIDTIYQGMGERIFADAQYRKGVETDYHNVRRMFMNAFRTCLQGLMRSNMEMKAQDLGNEKERDREVEYARRNNPRLSHGADEEKNNWHGSVFYDTDEEGEVIDIASPSTEVGVPNNETSVPNPTSPISDDEKPWKDPGCYDAEEEVQQTYIILEEAWQACQNADRAISSLTIQLTKRASMDDAAQDSTLQETVEDEVMTYEGEPRALAMLGKQQSLDEKQKLLGDGEITAQGPANGPYGPWDGAVDRVIAEGSAETLVVSNSEEFAIKPDLPIDAQESEPEHFAWARAQDGLKAERGNDVDWGNCVSAWKGVVAEEQLDESRAEWIGAADMGENDIKDEVEAEMLREEHYGEGNSALVAQCGLVL